MKQAKQFARDFKNGASPETLQIEGGQIAKQALIAAQNAVDAGAIGGHAQLTDPGVSTNLPAKAGPRGVNTAG